MTIHEVIKLLIHEPNQNAEVHGLVVDGNKLYLFYEGNKICEITSE